MAEKTKPPPKKKRRAKTPDERLTALHQAQARIQLKINAEKKKLSQQERKEDTREKIILGSIVLVNMQRDQQFADYLSVKINNYWKTAAEPKRAAKDKEFLSYRARKRNDEAQT